MGGGQTKPARGDDEDTTSSSSQPNDTDHMYQLQQDCDNDGNDFETTDEGSLSDVDDDYSRTRGPFTVDTHRQVCMLDVTRGPVSFPLLPRGAIEQHKVDTIELVLSTAAAAQSRRASRKSIGADVDGATAAAAAAAGGGGGGTSTPSLVRRHSSKRMAVIPPNLQLPSISSIRKVPALVKLLVSQEVSDNVTLIADHFLAECRTFTSITFESPAPLTRVASIGRSFASNCTNLQDINLDGRFPSVTSIGNDFLSGCKRLKSVSFNGTFPALRTIGDGFMRGCASVVEVRFAHDSFPVVVEIGKHFLSECRNLATVAFGNNFSAVHRIGAYFLHDCHFLTTFDDSESDILINVVDLHGYFMEQCNRLFRLDFSRGQFSNIKSVNGRFLAHCQGLRMITFSPTSFNNADCVHAEFMYNCGNMTHIHWNGCKFPNVTKINQRFLGSCHSLERLELSDGFFPRALSVGAGFATAYGHSVALKLIDFSHSFKNVVRLADHCFPMPPKSCEVKLDGSFLNAPLRAQAVITHQEVMDVSWCFFGERLNKTECPFSCKVLYVSDANKAQFDYQHRPLVVSPANLSKVLELNDERNVSAEPLLIMKYHKWSWKLHQHAPLYIRLAVCAIFSGHLTFVDSKKGDHSEERQRPLPSEVCNEICGFIDVTWKQSYAEVW